MLIVICRKNCVFHIKLPVTECAIDNTVKDYCEIDHMTI